MWHSSLMSIRNNAIKQCLLIHTKQLSTIVIKNELKICEMTLSNKMRIFWLMFTKSRDCRL